LYLLWFLQSTEKSCAWNISRIIISSLWNIRWFEELHLEFSWTTIELRLSQGLSHLIFTYLHYIWSVLLESNFWFEKMEFRKANWSAWSYEHLELCQDVFCCIWPRLAILSFTALIQHSMPSLVLVSVQKFPIFLMGFPLYVMYFYFFIAFNILTIICFAEVLFGSHLCGALSQIPPVSKVRISRNQSSPLAPGICDPLTKFSWHNSPLLPQIFTFMESVRVNSTNLL
jgi:hypothetical protein